MDWSFSSVLSSPAGWWLVRGWYKYHDWLGIITTIIQQGIPINQPGLNGMTNGILRVGWTSLAAKIPILQRWMHPSSMAEKNATPQGYIISTYFHFWTGNIHQHSTSSAGRSRLSPPCDVKFCCFFHRRNHWILRSLQWNRFLNPLIRNKIRPWSKDQPPWSGDAQGGDLGMSPWGNSAWGSNGEIVHFLSFFFFSNNGSCSMRRGSVKNWRQFLPFLAIRIGSVLDIFRSIILSYSIIFW